MRKERKYRMCCLLVWYNFPNSSGTLPEHRNGKPTLSFKESCVGSAGILALKRSRPRRHARVFPETFGERLGSSMLHYGGQLACPLLPSCHNQSIRITAAFFGLAKFEWFLASTRVQCILLISKRPSVYQFSRCHNRDSDWLSN